MEKNGGSRQCFACKDNPQQFRKISFRYMAFAVNKGKHTLIKYVVDKERNIDE